MSVVLLYGHLSTVNTVIFSILCEGTELGAVNSPGNLNYGRCPKMNWSSVKCWYTT